MTMTARTYIVGVRGQNWDESVIALSRGKAKADYWRDVVDSWQNVKYTDITCRIGGISMSTLAAFARTAEYRGVPFAQIGMRVQVGDWAGIIAGKNDSSNFNILFTDGPHKGQTGNCHPNWMIRYFDAAGNIIKEFKS